MAAEWAGFETVAQCEIDEYASKVLAKKFKGVPNLHDIRTVTNERLAEFGIDGKEITVISAGFPCQPYSLAGKGHGDRDSRDLWGEVARVLREIKRLGSSVKILPVYLQGKISDSSDGYSMTLPRWGIASGGEFGELATSARHTEENASSCWVGTPTACMSKRSKRYREGRTPNPAELAETFPTPLSSDAIRMRYSEESLRKVGMRRTHGEYKKAGCNLSEYVAAFPTPQATSWGCSGARAKLKDLETHGVITETERKGMQAGNGGKLNPMWVEWLMGFPLGWTDLDASETQ